MSDKRWKAQPESVSIADSPRLVKALIDSDDPEDRLKGYAALCDAQYDAILALRAVYDVELGLHSGMCLSDYVGKSCGDRSCKAAKSLSRVLKMKPS